VICGGVIVYPGDIIFGDLEGVVVLPRAEVERIVAASGGYQGRAAAEAAAGQPYYERRRSEEKLRALPDVEFL
jgi:regulator of RNase E activity RraA